MLGDILKTSVWVGLRPSISLHFCNGCPQTHVCDYILCPGARSNMTGAVVAVAEGMRSEGLCTEGMHTYFEAFALGAARTFDAGHDLATKLPNAFGLPPSREVDDHHR